MSRTAELRTYAEKMYNESLQGLKEANDRVDKLLGLCLVAIGWVGSRPERMYCSIFLLLFAALILLLGRGTVKSSAPADFEEFTNMAKHWGADESKQFEFDVARQYAISTHENGEITGRIHIRLFLGIILLGLGLIAFATRI